MSQGVCLKCTRAYDDHEMVGKVIVCPPGAYGLFSGPKGPASVPKKTRKIEKPEEPDNFEGVSA